MTGSFEEAYFAAQKAVAPSVWEQLPDSERLRAIRDHMCKMDAQQVNTAVEKYRLPADRPLPINGRYRET